MIVSVLSNIGRAAQRFVTANNPWTNIYGLCRSMLAFSSLLALLCNPSVALFDIPGACQGPGRYTLL